MSDYMFTFYEHICENGHSKAETSHVGVTNGFCEKCGAKVLEHCPNCGKDFESCTVYFEIAPELEKPFYCKGCGKPFPWTVAAIENARLLIEEDDQVDARAKELAAASLRDVMLETPGTQLALVRLQKIMKSAGSFTVDAIRQFVIEFGCELAKKQLGL